MKWLLLAKAGGMSAGARDIVWLEQHMSRSELDAARKQVHDWSAVYVQH